MGVGHPVSRVISTAGFELYAGWPAGVSAGGDCALMQPREPSRGRASDLLFGRMQFRETLHEFQLRMTRGDRQVARQLAVALDREVGLKPPSWSDVGVRLPAQGIAVAAQHHAHAGDAGLVAASELHRPRASLDGRNAAHDRVSPSLRLPQRLRLASPTADREVGVVSDALPHQRDFEPTWRGFDPVHVALLGTAPAHRDLKRRRPTEPLGAAP